MKEITSNVFRTVYFVLWTAKTTEQTIIKTENETQWIIET